jgi:hypothetical protein
MPSYRQFCPVAKTMTSVGRCSWCVNYSKAVSISAICGAAYPRCRPPFCPSGGESLRDGGIGG